MTEAERAVLTDQLVVLRKIRRSTIRAERKIYYGSHPCAERARNPAFDAACIATEKATADCNEIIDKLNASI
jgi:hypothetical protein